jgi:hypothetical protein
MGKKHDEIVFSLTKEKIVELLAEKLYGEKSSWSEFHDIHKKEIEEIKLETLKRVPEENNLTAKQIKDIYTLNNQEIEDTPLSHSLIILRRTEVPITKGEGQYKTTKGYFDLICDVKPKIKGQFSCYQNKEPKQICIEVKQKKDFDDTGSILRQVNEYKEYYFYNQKRSNIFDYDSYYAAKRNTVFVIYCDEQIDEIPRTMLEEEGYIVLTKTNNGGSQ